tara:strand:+ start:65480 stop:66550 length:1071 start_codon:yes stop_codon:yes gene_type:complete
MVPLGMKSLVGLLITLMLCVSCESNTSGNTVLNDPSALPLGAEVSGITFGGHLVGKKAYLLGSDINLPNCWIDSVVWKDQNLYFAVAGIDYTALANGQGLNADDECSLPDNQIDIHFDMYSASLENGEWDITAIGVNDTGSQAGLDYNTGTLAYTQYPADNNWEIYFSDFSGGVWGSPESYSQNSSCREDNPHIFDDGNKIIFESSRTVADGSVCDSTPDNKYLYLSTKTGSTWSSPVAINGVPGVGAKNTQPWFDEENDYLYWTADTECGCVRRVSFDGSTVSGDSEDILTPALGELAGGTADGKVVFLGEYSEQDNYAFFACGIASDVDPSGSTVGLFNGRYKVDIQLCVIPLE